MKSAVTVLLLLLTYSTGFANLQDDKKARKETQSNSSKSSCCSYQEFASKNKRVKKSAATNQCNQGKAK